MKKILLDFSRYADGPLLVLSQAILAALTGNAFFPALSNPSLADFQTAVNAYEAALAAAADRGRNNVAAKYARKTELINLLFKMALQCMKVADSNLEALISSGFPLSKTKAPLPPLGIVTIDRIELGLNSGELAVFLLSLTGARTYVYQYTPDPLTPDSEWTNLNSTITKETITGLEVGKRYWIRVIAYGTNNQMTVCDPVLSKIVQ